jgi:oxygen-dependent protoporphyrinogen oxidase
MRGRLLFITGAAVGYVLGARAGRKRYEQIKSAAAKVWESPGIQRQVGQLEDYAAAKVGDIPGAIYVGVRRLVAGRAHRHDDAPRPATGPRPIPPAATTGGSSGPIPPGTLPPTAG